MEIRLPTLADVQMTDQQAAIREAATALLALLAEAVPSDVVHYAVEGTIGPLLILRAQAPKIHTADWQG